MAVAYQSSATTAFANVNTGNNLVISKPSGLAVGDIMVLHIAYSNAGGFSSTAWNYPDATWLNLAGTPSVGPTILETDNHIGIAVGYVVATSSHVAASDFSFGLGGGSNVSASGALLRIDGQDTSSPIAAYLASNISNDSTPTFPTGITPTESCLLFILSSAWVTAGFTISGYAITTSNPAWTERYDLTNSSNAVMSGATATRPETTSTGAWDITLDGADATSDSVSIILAIKPIANVTVTPDVNVIAISQPAPVISASSEVTPSAVSIASSIPAPTVSAKSTNASNQSKNQVTVTNQSKNQVTVTNETKNSVTVTNESKNSYEN